MTPGRARWPASRQWTCSLADHSAGFRRVGVLSDGQAKVPLDRLIGNIRGSFPGAGGVNQQVRLGGGLPTFLHAVRQAVNTQGDEFSCNYVHNAKQFNLSLFRTEDPRMAAALGDRRVTKRPDAIRRYEGTIKDGAGQTPARQWSFRFWREDGTATRLPLRIEFQPKPMLRLSLELAANQRNA